METIVGVMSLRIIHFSISGSVHLAKSNILSRFIIFIVKLFEELFKLFNMDNPAPGPATERISITRRVLLQYYKECNASNSFERFESLVNKVKTLTRSIENLSAKSRKLLSKFINQYKSKWKAAKRNIGYFNRTQEIWLNGAIDFLIKTPIRQGGRPSKNFMESSERSKRRKTEEVRSSLDTPELAYATQMKLRADGHLEAAKSLKGLFDQQNTTNTETPSYTAYTPDEALALISDAKLSKYQYNLIRQTVLDHGCKIYPNYEAVIAAKKRCYPENIHVTESSAEVPLQNLLNHTTERLLLTLKDVILSLKDDQLKNLRLITKWGCDGTSGQAEYKQLFEDDTISDASIYAMCTVPIQVEIISEGNTRSLIWRNPRASSPKTCRPLKIFFAKETSELTKHEVQNINRQIDALIPTHLQIDDKSLIIHHHLILSMVDLKTVYAITDTKSTQRCYLCGMTSKSFNHISVCLNQNINNREWLNFGISPLHAWIRLFECLIHMSYKVKIAKWQARTKEEKEIVENTKKYIQEQFRQRMGLLVDKPKQGFGSSNDGNTARRFFHNYEESAEITGINKNLIYRFYIILLVLVSNFSINATKFKKYCLKTAVVFVKNYPWYNMPTTLHKILFHGHEILQHTIVPLGLLSEEAQECRNKDIKSFRERHSRKFSRIQTMEDVFHQLLISSDPYISDMFSTKYNKTKMIQEYPPEVKEMFDLVM